MCGRNTRDTFWFYVLSLGAPLCGGHGWLVCHHAILVCILGGFTYIHIIIRLFIYYYTGAFWRNHWNILCVICGCVCVMGGGGVVVLTHLQIKWKTDLFKMKTKKILFSLFVILFYMLYVGTYTLNFSSFFSACLFKYKFSSFVCEIINVFVCGCTKFMH